ncbi:MAG TPA: beta-xylosidase [Bryobacteraceae bacterium]|jgi:xylan 1,4-beta-xylosidase|nr:beta-xylosidase [Bryobacteraceae bacterium]
MSLPRCLIPLLLAPALAAQTEIRVDAAARQGPFPPVYAWFGYDEPNYTYTPNGEKLLAEMAASSPVRISVRVHHLLITGDGTAAMKWGSTNAYTEDAHGNPIYDWTIVDRIFDTYMRLHIRPFVEIGFMPEALSSQPEPYARNWPNTPEGRGWAQPPKDYAKWAELVRQWVLHAVARYGQPEVETWQWELWNEPDIFYWRGTPEEYDKLYDVTAAAIRRALPTAKVGGPATTNPTSEHAGGYLRQFLQHCALTHQPLDFISFHAKGSPHIVDGHLRMGLRQNLTAVQRGVAIVNEFPEFRNLPLVVSESDPEGCGACPANGHPELSYRNGTVYPTYTAAMLGNILKLADSTHTNIQGMLTWAFEFEDKQYFEGFRTLSTNGIDKPLMNLFRMAGLLGGDRIALESTGAQGLDAILQSGVTGAPDIDGVATRSDREVSVLVWNYHDDDVAVPPSPVRLSLTGLPAAGRVLVTHYRIDRDHSNAYTAWQRMGSPQNPDADQRAQLVAAGQLQLLGSPGWRTVEGSKLQLEFSMPRQSVSLLTVRW